MNRVFNCCLFLTVCLTSLTAWCLADEKATDPKKPASAATAQFEQLKKLVGEWSGTGEHVGQDKFETTVKYRLTANGSTLVETLFCDSDHEMFTMYHLDGDRVLLTHYCAAGNQPRMRAESSADPKTIAFKFLDGTNLKPDTDLHMHDATLKFVGDDHIQTEWILHVKGQPAGAAKFDLKRKKK